MNEVSCYAAKNGLSPNLRNQMLSHVQLKYKAAKLQQDEVIAMLPKAIRSSIAKHLFLGIVESSYLFKEVNQDLIVQMVMNI